MAFANLPKNRGRYPEIEALFGGHIFDRICNAPCRAVPLLPPGDRTAMASSAVSPNPTTPGRMVRLNG
jgi:hypothetical protein